MAESHNFWAVQKGITFICYDCKLYDMLKNLLIKFHISETFHIFTHRKKKYE